MSLPLFDLAAYSLLAIVALFPLISNGLSALGTIRLPAWRPAAPAEPTKEQWQSAWIGRLVSLQNELEERKMPAAVKLCRELTWELLGGGGQ